MNWEWEELCEFGDDPLEEHYEAVVGLSHSWQWIGHDGKFVDLRKAPIQHIYNLAVWMVKMDTRNTPYTGTAQFDYVQKRIEKNLKWMDLADKILKKKDK